MYLYLRGMYGKCFGKKYETDYTKRMFLLIKILFLFKQMDSRLETKERIVSWQRKRMETVTHLQDAQS